MKTVNNDKHVAHFKNAFEETQVEDVYAVTLSSSNVDRQGDTIAVDGWHVKGQPVTQTPNGSLRVPLQLDHDSSVLKTVGYVDGLHYVGDRVKGQIHIAPKGISPLIDEVRARMKAGLIKDTSVGFVPDDWEELGSYGTAWKRQELMELSLVSQPANADATIGASAVARLKAFLGKTIVVEFEGEPDRQVPIKRGLGRKKTAPKNVPSVASVLKVLKGITVEEGRVLSASNEQALRRAVQELEAVLSQLDAGKSRSHKTWSDEAREAAAEARRQNAASQQAYDADDEAGGSAAWQASADAANNASTAAANATQAATEASQRAETSGSAEDHAAAAAAHADAQSAHQHAAQANVYADGSEDGSDPGQNAVTSSIIEDHTSQAGQHGEHASRHGSQAGKALSPRVRQRIAAMNTVDIEDDIDLNMLSRKEIADAISGVVAAELLRVTGRILD